MLCLSSCVEKIDQQKRKHVYYHVVRYKEFQILEGVIAVIEYMFRTTGSDLRNTDLCLYQVCSIMKWKFSGMCTYCENIDTDMQYYKKSTENKALHCLIEEVWPRMGSKTFTIRDAMTNQNIACAGRMIEEEKKELLNCINTGSYSEMMNLKKDDITKQLSHFQYSERTKPIQFKSETCFRTKSVSLRSYALYKIISKPFPLRFRYCSISEYYTYLLRKDFII